MESKINSVAKVGARTRQVATAAKAQKQPAIAIELLDQVGTHQLDYRVQTKQQVIRAKKVEAALVDDYREWLEQQDRKLSVAKYGHLQCDCYEEARHNQLETEFWKAKTTFLEQYGSLRESALKEWRTMADPSPVAGWSGTPSSKRYGLVGHPGMI